MKISTIFSISVAGLFILSAAAGLLGSSALTSNDQLNLVPMIPVTGIAVGPSYTKTESLNWAGYAVSGIGIIDIAQGSWVQTATTCNQTASGAQITAHWAGIDGFASNTVEQTGTLAECLKGKATPQYFAWYEFYPAQSIITITGFKVNVGDVFSATILAKTASSFTLILNDTTTGQSFTVKNPAGFTGERSSAECITEEPKGPNGLLLLAQYSKDPWGVDHTKLSGCTADGEPFGSFTINTYEITDVNENNIKVVMDKPTALSADGTSFQMLWESEGP
jgi:hypothetical protein